jgi:hypothetical protein
MVSSIRPGGDKVDDEIEAGRLLDRDVGGLAGRQGNRSQGDPRLFDVGARMAEFRCRAVSSLGASVSGQKTKCENFERQGKTTSEDRDAGRKNSENGRGNQERHF